MLFTSSVAREWTDWPIRTSFVPVMQQAMRLLAGIEDRALQPPSVVGSNRAIRNAGLLATSARSPSHRELHLEPSATGETVLGPLTEIGVWRVQLVAPDGHKSESRAADVPVVFDPKESDTRRLDPRELSARYGGVVTTEAVAQGAGHGLSLWTKLIVAAILFLLFEALLGG
jgi:hypothetical protein